MKAKHIFLALICMTLINCKKNLEKVETPIETSESTTNHKEIPNLKLNNGQKWTANLETHQGFQNMDSILKIFRKEGTENYKLLGENLSTQTNFVIKNCTMKGESHDELHVILLPVLEQISTLKESENSIDAQNAFNRLEEMVQEYFVYFRI